MKTLSLSSLIERQSGAARKHPAFPELKAMLRDSSRLRAVRLVGRAIRLLDEPRLEPRFLENFYVTYRVRKHPFYAIFLGLKWDTLERLEKTRSDKRKRIEAIMAGYPEDILRLMRWLRAAEGRRRPEAPVVSRVLLPRTLKRAREIAGYARFRWSALLRTAIAAVEESYRTIVLPDAEELIARSVLDSLPDPRTGKVPPDARVRARFRALSKSCHPDSAEIPQSSASSSKRGTRCWGAAGDDGPAAGPSP